MTRTMSNKAFFSGALSALMLGGTMVGCSGAAMQAHPSLASAKPANQAATFAAQAEAALGKRAVPAALIAAEAAVAGQPDNAAYRVLLGRAYLADGRFQSAETAFEDAMTLGNNGVRTIVSLALAKVALGKAPAARALLTSHMDSLPAADYGLAIAVAGDAQEGVRVLSQAAQDPAADVKTRQNFAYALALSGNWRDARVMAGQDLDPAAAARRILGWAATADAGAEPQRVAALVGTEIRADDAGMPTRLALTAPTAGVSMLAQAPEAPAVETPAAVQDAAPVAVAVAAADPAPVVEKAVETPFIKAPATPVRKAVLAEAPRIGRDAIKSMMRNAALIKPMAKPLGDNASSPWVVQLGAYESAAVAKDSWQRMARRHASLNDYGVVNSNVTVNGRVFYRLAIKGFGDRASADAMCRSVRARSGQCFVRAGTPDAKPANWASAAPKRQQFASR